MILKCLTSVVIGLLFTTCLTAAQIEGDVKQVSFDPKTGIAVFEVRNFSNKTITAFNLSVNMVYEGGKTNHGEDLADFSPAIMANKIDFGNLSADGGLRPGGTKQETIHCNPLLSGSVLQSINVVLDVVVYDDNSAVVTNKDAFKRVATERQGRANTKARVAAILSKHLSSSESDPLASANVDLRELESYAHSHPEELLSGDITATLQNLQRAPRGAEREFLAQYAARENKYKAESALSAKIEAQP